VQEFGATTDREAILSSKFPTFASSMMSYGGGCKHDCNARPHRFATVLPTLNLRSGFVAGCGVCDRPLSLFRQDYLGCKAGVHGTCRNRRTIRRAVLGMDMLRRQLMQPELVAEFVAEFRREWQRLLVESKARAGIDLRERAALDRKIANLPDAIFDGRTSPAVMARLAELEAQ
jgi:hypothetical protein